MLRHHINFLSSRRACLYGLIICCVLFFQGCAPTTSVARGDADDILAEQHKQQALFMDTLWKRGARLADLAWPLKRHGAVLCGDDVENQFGIIPITLDDISDDYRDAIEIEFLISDHPSVLHVTHNSPAMLAGIKRGDKFISIAGEPVTTGNRTTTRLRERISVAAETGSPVRFELSRAGIIQSYTLTPEKVCNYDMELLPQDELNAFADGNTVYVTQGMMRFTENDQELQLVIAHEIAHNSEGHIDKTMGNYLLGALADLAAAAYGIDTEGIFSDLAGSVFSQAFEREADYVGMYLLARAGIDTVEVSNFWRRMAAEYPGNIKGTFTSSHPATAERYTNIDAAHQEIQEKLTNNLPLMPERK